jgi:nicotinate-nucleotide pyrophosphorylase (carboxylating)
MNPNQVREVLNWMQSIESGSGDLTTETIAPYALHAEGSFLAKDEGLFSGREILEILFESSGKQLDVFWNKQEGENLQKNALIFSFQGNGADILNNRRLIQWLVGRMSALATACHRAVDFLKPYGKVLIQGIAVNPIFEVFDAIAFETGGGIWQRNGLNDSVYITQNHLRYADEIEKVLERVNRELGDIRKKIRIEVEVNRAQQFEQVKEMDIDTIHLVGLSRMDIENVFEKQNPIKKPILHLERLLDFQASYADYFFKYCAIEELHQNSQSLNCEWVFKADPNQNK